jgi:hypothetical protein
MATKSAGARATARTSPAATANPKGVGAAVAFIWALGGQMLTGAFFEITQDSRKHTSGISPTLIVIGYLIAAGILIVWGENLRAGRQWAWASAAALTGLLGLGGLVMLPSTIISVAHHNFWPVYVQVILLFFAPFICYRLLQPPTRQWYATVSAAAARLRHGAPTWLAITIASAAAGGIFTAWIERQY